MVRRIRPVSRVLRMEAEIRRPGTAAAAGRVEPSGLDAAWLPAVDVSERGDRIVIEMETPGIDRRDIGILLFDNRVEVRGWKREDAAGAGLRYHRVEREFGTFRRTVFLPAAVAAGGAAASLENGVLTISLPKAPRVARRIEIGREDADAKTENDNGEHRS